MQASENPRLKMSREVIETKLHELYNKWFNFYEVFQKIDISKNFNCFYNNSMEFHNIVKYEKALLASCFYPCKELLNELMTEEIWFSSNVDYRISITYAVNTKLNAIKAILDRIEFFEEEIEIEKVDKLIINDEIKNLNKVFIVHGHDEGMMHHVARIIEKESDYEAVILSEKPNEGQTVIEKFEKQAKEAGFAVILMSPDDVGNSKKEYETKNALNERARQNVLFEFGFFTGYLGRKRIAVIYKEGVEIPSDLNGVIYLNYDKDDWKSELMKEIKNLEIQSCS